MPATRVRLEEPPVAADAFPEGAPLTDLLQLLLDRVARQPGIADRALPREAGEVVFALDLGPARYTLLRHEVEPPPARLSLSPREREIARLIAKGLPNKTIAAVLDISLWTVGTYVRRLFAKLGVGSRAEMVACLMKQGMLEPER